MQKRKRNNPLGLIIMLFFIVFSINPIFGIVSLSIIVLIIIKFRTAIYSYILKDLQESAESNNDLVSDDKNNMLQEISQVEAVGVSNHIIHDNRVLDRHKKYLQVALNNDLEDARSIISKLPVSDRILIEVGTPLIKMYGKKAISRVRSIVGASTYIIADNKCADMASREVEIMSRAGANASTCLGIAPLETIDSFISECERLNIDSVIDMMNVDNPIILLKKLKKLPKVVMIHRGVDESEFSKEKQIPYHQIKQIKGSYNVLIAIAGGDDIREVQRAVFNEANIVVVWKDFYKSKSNTSELAESFLKEIK